MRELEKSAASGHSGDRNLPTLALDSKLVRIVKAVLIFQISLFQEFRSFHFGSE